MTQLRRQYFDKVTAMTVLASSGLSCPSICTQNISNTFLLTNLERGFKKTLGAGINARQPPQTAPPGRRLHVTTNLLQLKQRVNDDQIYPLSVNRDL